MGQRILIVNETPIGKDERAWLEARTLAQAGYSVSVICPKERRDEDSRREVAGIHVHSYSPPREPTSLWSHAWELAYCWMQTARLSLALAFSSGFDVLHACNPPDTFFLLAALFKPFRKKFVFAQHDLVPELWFSRYGDRGRVGRLLHSGLLGMERLSYRLADIVIVPNESYKGVALRRGKRDPDTVFVVRNGPDLDKVRLADSVGALRCGRRHLVCYLGIMNPQDGVDYLLRAIEYLVHEQGRTDTHYALVGSGDIQAQLEELSRELGIEEYVTFTGWVSDPALLSAYLRTADVCVAPDPETPLNRVSSFMKIMDYMAVERPIVAFDLAETRVSAGGAALYATPDDISDFADKISRLLDSPDQRAEMGRLGRERIENGLAWKHQEPLLLSAYATLLAGPKAAAEEPPVAASLGVHLPGDSISAATAVGRPCVNIDSLDGKRQFLEFWGLPWVVGGAGDVSLISADSWETRPADAVVLLSASGRPALYRTSNGIALFASVRHIAEVPLGMESIAEIANDRGKRVSFILRDTERNTFYLPFSLDAAFDGFQLERYKQGRKFPPDALLRLYYTLKPLLPASVLAHGRRLLAKLQEKTPFPEWPIELSLEHLRRFVLALLLSASKSAELPFIWFWPSGREYCLVLTHDVESKLADNQGIWRLIEAEKARGLRSSFNVVPFKYPVGEDVLERLRSEGCEVGVHGYSHDGTLFRDKRRFPARVREINEIGRVWGAAGFRSASTYRDADMLGALEFDYDLSFFDTDPYEPQPGGCLSLFPYFIGDLVEIPMTLPQDYTVFVVRKEADDRIWRHKLDLLREMGGLVCLNAHPDNGYIGDEGQVGRYLGFLEVFSADDGLWNPLAGELAGWWRARREARIVQNGDGFAIEGGTEEMEIRLARLVDGQVTFVPLSGGPRP